MRWSRVRLQLMGRELTAEGDAAVVVSNPSARVIALIHHTMLASCVVHATVQRQSRKVPPNVDLYRRNADITRLPRCEHGDTPSRYADWTAMRLVMRASFSLSVAERSWRAQRAQSCCQPARAESIGWLEGTTS